MFEEVDGQNETKFNDQSASRGPYGIARPGALDDSPMADQISSGKMFATPQPGNASGDFLNQNMFPGNPGTGNGSPQVDLPAAGTNGQTTATQNPVRVRPIQTRDAQGKTLPKYRMGVGQRILATVANFANGFARNGAAPIYVGPGALNNRYYQDEAIRQQQNRESLPSTTLVPDSGTQPQSDGSEQTNNTPALRRNAYNARLQTPARRAWQTILNTKAPTGNSYTYTAINPGTGQRVGSNDGVNWRDVTDSGSRLS